MALSSSSITKSQLDRCILLYRGVVEKAYDKRIKDSKKRSEAKARDQWRYGELPTEVKDGKGMTLTQLERLVQWKITHGQSRPFLPAMIRKNESPAVTKATETVASLLSSLSPDMPVQKSLEVALSALDAASKLTGVGPATAALILAVYDAENVPFFQDELFAWCLPEKAGVKLKYDRKEYTALFKRSQEIRQRLGNNTRMVDLEQASFVLQHLDLVKESDRLSLETTGVGNAQAGEPGTNDKIQTELSTPADKQDKDSKGRPTGKTVEKPAVPAKRKDLSDDKAAQRRSKRVK